MNLLQHAWKMPDSLQEVKCQLGIWRMRAGTAITEVFPYYRSRSQNLQELNVGNIFSAIPPVTGHIPKQNVYLDPPLVGWVEDALIFTLN